MLGADTAVALAGRVLGQPADAAGAREMIGALSGAWHEVTSAVALIHAGGEVVEHSTTRVRFRKLSDPEVDWYVGTGEWHGRAGGYAIQGTGAAVVAEIDGDYTTVVGLPLPLLAALLASVGLAPW